MGLVRRIRKKFKKPRHPFQAVRMQEESKLLRGYGFKNKTEIWKMAALLRNWQRQARNIISLSSEEREQAESLLISSLARLGILDKKAKLDDVLALTSKDVLERRLQTIVYRLGLAGTIKQARQFIVHQHVLVNNEKISSPAYLVKKDDKVSLIPGFASTRVIKRVLKAKPESVEEGSENA